MFASLTPLEMQNVKKFFLVPIGLPGMGKTTLSKALFAKVQDQKKNGQMLGVQQPNFPKINNFQKRAVIEQPEI